MCQLYNTQVGYSGSTYYRSTDNPGATNAFCFIVYDIDAPSAGYWTFATNPERFIYYDPSSAQNGAVVAFTADSCQQF
jgi:hypothetical protein